MNNKHRWDRRYSDFQRSHRTMTEGKYKIRNTILAMLTEGKHFITYRSVRADEGSFEEALKYYGLDYRVMKYNAELKSKRSSYTK